MLRPGKGVLLIPESVYITSIISEKVHVCQVGSLTSRSGYRVFNAMCAHHVHAGFTLTDDTPLLMSLRSAS